VSSRKKRRKRHHQQAGQAAREDRFAVARGWSRCRVRPKRRCSSASISTSLPARSFALLGTNGAGKSTLLGSHRRPGGADRRHRDIRRTRRHDGRIPNQTVSAGIVLIARFPVAFFPTLTVEENLRLAAWLYRKERRLRAERDRPGAVVLPGAARSGGVRRPATSRAASSRLLTLSQVFHREARGVSDDRPSSRSGSHR